MMIISRMNSIAALTALFIFISCQPDERKSLTPEEFLQETMTWLADDERKGRLAGTLQEAEAANYIADRFLQFGVIPAGDNDTYFDTFTLTGPMPQAMGQADYLSKNVVGLVQGTEKPDQYIIVGAHYDGQGMGGIISMDRDGEEAIHNSADDNASGTAGLLHLSREIALNPLKSSVLFIAFSGEELGLLGSRHFVKNMEIGKSAVLAMINLDMIGRVRDGKVTLFGTGTSDIWDELLDGIEHDSLSITRTPSGSGASDHTSFYDEGIPVLHYFSGTHEDYHRASDTSDKINYPGMIWVLDHLLQTVKALDEYSADGITFLENTEPQAQMMPSDGVTLGVTPDYSYTDNGFRVEGVSSGNPAKNAGMEAGDVILKLGNTEINDIYDYMESLGNFSPGDSVPVLVQRDGEIIELTVNF